MADRLIGKAGSEEAKWKFTDPFRKPWIPTLRLWHGYRKIRSRNIQMHLVTNDTGYQ